MLLLTAVPDGALLFISIVSHFYVLPHLRASAKSSRSLHWHTLCPGLPFFASPIRPATWCRIQRAALKARLPRNTSHGWCLCCWYNSIKFWWHNLSLELGPNNLLFRRLWRSIHRVRPTTIVLHSDYGRDQDLPMPIPQTQNTYHTLYADGCLGNSLLRTHLFHPTLLSIR